MEKIFTNLKVVLVEPKGPLNVGSVARLCANFEVHELRIISPKCDLYSLEAKRKVHTLTENHNKLTVLCSLLFKNIS